MKPRVKKAILSAAAAGLLVIPLNACAMRAATGAPVAVAAPQAAAPTAQPAAPTLGADIRALGEVKAAQDANLTFQVTGTVAQVLIKEGDQVKQGQLLAVLDTRLFDEKVSQAEAALQIAEAQLQTAQAQKQVALAQQSALTDPPKPALVRAVSAQVHAAQIAVAQARAGQQQGVTSAQAGLTAAQASLQTTRDKLSAAKTAADIAVSQAAEALTAAQARYSQAKENWDYIEETGKDPAGMSGVVYVPDPNPQNPAHFQPQKVEGKLTEAARRNYKSQLIQTEAAMRQAEEAVRQAQVAADAAHQGEVTGIQAAEQQVTQAQAGLDRLSLPADQDAVAQATAALELAQANLANLKPDPRPSERARLEATVAAADGAIAQAQANVAQATAALEQARLSRSYAEIHAPYDGTVAQVNVDPFDSSVTPGQPAIRVLDMSALRVEVQVSDADVVRVRVGQAVKVQVAALDTEYTGTISYVAPEATASGVNRTYLVRVALDDDDGLRAGMPVTVDIATS